MALLAAGCFTEGPAPHRTPIAATTFPSEIDAAASDVGRKETATPRAGVDAGSGGASGGSGGASLDAASLSDGGMESKGGAPGQGGQAGEGGQGGQSGQGGTAGGVEPEKGLVLLGAANAKFRGLTAAGDGTLFITGSIAQEAQDFGSRKILGVERFSDLFVGAISRDGASPWVRQIGDPASEQSGNDLAVTPQGQLAVIGNGKGDFKLGDALSVPLAGGSQFVATFDAKTGEGLWGTVAGVTGSTLLQAVAADRTAGAFVLCGYAGSLQDRNILVIKLAGADGTTLWRKSFGGAGNQSCESVGVDEAGAVIIAGGYQNELDFGGGALPTRMRPTLFVAKLDGATGESLWSYTPEASGRSSLFRLAVDAAGDVAVVFADSVVLDDAGGAQPVIFATGLSLPPDPSSATEDGSFIGEDVLALKLDGKTGQPVWAQRWGGRDTDQPGGVAFDSAGNVLVAGVFKAQMGTGDRALRNAASNTTSSFLVRADAASGAWLMGLAASAEVAPVMPMPGEPALVATTSRAGRVTLAGGSVFVQGLFSGRLNWGSKTETAIGLVATVDPVDYVQELGSLGAAP